ncbi:MAG: metalloregulator ArsR/SmtB family transcription factor [Mariprofundaceae bacterium]|nr:metalloregulator ArsR/SmtB family transcription factor [Mariprofundaceae bacterium]
MQSIPEANIQEAAQGLRAIAHELRLAVLCHLLDGPMCVNELIEATGASQSNLSQHLSKMRMMGIITNEKRGQQVYYRITKPEFLNLVHVLQTIYCPDVCTPVSEES